MDFTMTTQDLGSQVLDLPVKQRSELAAQLLASLDDLSETEIEQLWFAEAARRAAEIDSGKVQCISAGQVHQKALTFLR